MPLSRAQTRIVDPVLSNVAHGYSNQELAGQHLFPTIHIPVTGAKIMKFGKEGFVRYATARAPGSRTARVQYGYATDPVSLRQDALEAQVPRERWRDTASAPTVDHGGRAVKQVMRSISLGSEHEQATMAQDAANYGAGNKIQLAQASDYWSTPAADIKGQLDDGKDAIADKIGHDPNVLILPRAVYRAAKKNTAVIEQNKYTSGRSITLEMLAEFFEVEKIVVGNTLTAANKDADLTRIWNSIVLAYVPLESERDQEVPSYGYNYVLEGHPLVEEPYYENSTKSWIYPTEVEQRPYLTGMDAGYLIESPLG
jgi:hypothetical protein